MKNSLWKDYWSFFIPEYFEEDREIGLGFIVGIIVLPLAMFFILLHFISLPILVLIGKLVKKTRGEQ